MSNDDRYIEIHRYLTDYYQDEPGWHIGLINMTAEQFEGNEVADKLKEYRFGYFEEDYDKRFAALREFSYDHKEEFIETIMGDIIDIVFDKENKENYIVFTSEHGHVYDWVVTHFRGPDFERLGLR